MCRVTWRRIEVCYQPWCNPLWLTGLKIPANCHPLDVLCGFQLRLIWWLSVWWHKISLSHIRWCWHAKIHLMSRVTYIRDSETHLIVKSLMALKAQCHTYPIDFDMLALMSSMLPFEAPLRVVQRHYSGKVISTRDWHADFTSVVPFVGSSRG